MLPRIALCVFAIALVTTTARAQPVTIAGIGAEDLQVAANRVFFTTADGEFCFRRNDIWWVSAPGGTPQRLDAGTGSQPCDGFPNGLAVQWPYVYGFWNGQVTRKSIIFPSGPTDVVESVAPPNQYTNIAADADRLWMGTVANQLRCRPLEDLSTVTAIAVSGLHTRTFVAPGDGHVYYIADSNVYRWDGTSSPQLLETTILPALRLAVDATDVYWTTGLSGVGAVMKTPKAGGTTTTLCTDSSALFADIVVDGVNVYVKRATVMGQQTIFRVPKSTGVATPVTDQPDIRVLRQDDTHLYWTSQTGVWRIQKDAAITRPDLRWEFSGTIEVAQAVQGLDGASSQASLAAGRPTIARVYPRTQTGTVSFVEATLRGFNASGDELPGSPLRPTDWAYMSVGPSVDRASFDSSFNFILPDSWVAHTGTIRLRATLDPYSRVLESNESNNLTPLQPFTFTEKHPLTLNFVRVSTHAPPYTGFPDAMSSGENVWFWRVFHRAWTMLPASRFHAVKSACVLAESQPRLSDLGATGPYELDGEKCYPLGIVCMPEDQWVMNELATVDIASSPLTTGARNHTVGMIHPETEWRWGGLGQAPGRSSMVKMYGEGGAYESPSTPFGGKAIAHELTHNFGYGHVLCDGSEAAGGEIDFSYPYPACQIGPSLATAGRVLGYDGFWRRTIIETDVDPYMSYSGGGQWTNPYHWNGILAQQRTRGGSPLPPSPDVLLVTVVHDPVSGSLKIASCRWLARSHVPESNLDEAWGRQVDLLETTEPTGRISLRDVTNTEVAAYDFAVPRAPHTTATAIQTALLTFPCGSEVRSIVIEPARGNTPSFVRGATAHPPVISSCNSPTPGQVFASNAPITLTWTATDGDNDVLSYIIQYTRDNGATWHVVAMPTGTNSVTFEGPEALPGSATATGAGSSRFRIIASDGFDSFALESPTFRVENHAPKAAVVTPTDGTVFKPGEQVMVQAVGADFDTPLLEAPGRYNWLIGGTLVASTDVPWYVFSDGFNPGEYVLGVEVVDPQGLFSPVDSVSIVVALDPELPPADTDGDGVPDASDNCPNRYNPTQTDADKDGYGDDCDNCFATFQSSQIDMDDDGIGDACDPCPHGLTIGIGTDGEADTAYGPPLAVQDTQTSAGDNTDPSGDTANGSELDVLYAAIDCDTLHLMLAGNLSSLNNKLEIFFDTRAGGQNRLVNVPAIGTPALTRLADDGRGNGLRFDADFSADFFVGLNLVDQGSGPQLDVYWADLGPVPVGLFCGSGGTRTDGELSGAPPASPRLRATVSNQNIAGVTAGSGQSSGSGVTTGIELKIPLSALGDPTCDLKVTAFINSPNRNNVSNQVLPGIGGGGPLGDPRNLNFAAVSGPQHASVVRTTVSAASGTVRIAPSGAESLTVAVAVNAPVPYAVLWRRNGLPITNDDRISGAQTLVLRIDPVTASDPGLYDAVVTTSCGTFTSPAFPFRITLCAADFNQNGVVNSTDVSDFINAWFEDQVEGTLVTDFDDNGVVNSTDVSEFINVWYEDIAAGCGT